VAAVLLVVAVQGVIGHLSGLLVVVHLLSLR
jgi:hypothetical protein